MNDLLSRRTILTSAFALAWGSSACASTSKRTKPRVQLRTSLGEIIIAVNQERAPHSAASFLAYVDGGLFDEAKFYRAVHQDNDLNPVKIAVVQGGVVDESKLLAPIPLESTRQTGLMHTDGTLSIARAAPGSGSGGIFFICIGDQHALDFGGKRNPDGLGFAAFGTVVAGMDVVRAIWARPTAGSDGSMRAQMLASPVDILSARRYR